MALFKLLYYFSAHILSFHFAFKFILIKGFLNTKSPLSIKIYVWVLSHLLKVSFRISPLTNVNILYQASSLLTVYGPDTIFNFPKENCFPNKSQ